MKLYAKILMVSAFCDIICMLGMMLTIVKWLILLLSFY